MKTMLLTEEQLFAKLHNINNPFYSQYYAFYSSWYGGIITHPSLMLLPIDDHMVHRGDGVFEAVKAEGRAVYLLDEHLERLMRSAEKIALTSSLSVAAMKEIIIDTLRVADKENALLRIYLSRGPGNFSVNPYDSVGAQFYVVVTKLTAPSVQQYAQGVAIGKSQIPCKEGWLAQIKSCNYLQNVLMKKEAVDNHVEYVISLNAQGMIAEGFTENIMIYDKNGCLAHPPLNGILKGITMMRACKLAREHGIAVIERPISYNELIDASEVMMTGTSLDVLPVSRVDQKQITLGPVAKQLRELMRTDIKTGDRRTEY